MLIPKKTKYRVYHRLPYTKGIEGNNNWRYLLAKGNKEVKWGEYGLQACQGGWITSKQIEAARKAIVKYTKKFGEMRRNIFPHLPRSKKPLEVRMGGGKGPIESWVSVVKVGTILFEVRGLPKDTSYESLKAANYKLPIDCKVIEKNKVE